MDDYRLALQQETDYGRSLYRGCCRTCSHNASSRVDRFVGGILYRSDNADNMFFMVAVVKPKFKYDDALDAFGVHGIGGVVGSILTGVFATRFITGDGGAEGALYGDWHQLWIQLVATFVSIVFSAVVTFVLYKIVDRWIGIRVDKRVEEEGLDIYEHGESAYN